MRHFCHFRWLPALALAGLSLAAAAATPTGPLKLLRVIPGNQVQTPGKYAAPGQEIVFKFDRDMEPLGQLGRTSAIPIQISPAVPCQWRWLDPTELACRLPGRKRLRPATRYRITVGTQLAALDGNHLGKAIFLHFTTVLPQVEWMMLQKWLSPVTPEYIVKFNLPVTKQSVRKSLVFTNGTENVPANVLPPPRNRDDEVSRWLPVPGKPGIAIHVIEPVPTTSETAASLPRQTKSSWLVSPARKLLPATTYRLHAEAGLRTPPGPLPGKGGADVGIRFRTYGPFELTKIACATADGSSASYTPTKTANTRCLPNSIGVEFSAPVPASTLSALRWQPSAPPKALWPEDWESDSLTDENRADWLLTGLPFVLQPMTRYTVTAPAGVEDLFGRSLKKATRISFPTGHRAPSISDIPDNAVLEASESTRVPLSFTNLANLHFSSRALFARELEAASDTINASPATTVSILARNGTAVTKDATISVPLGLRKALDGHSGVLWGTLGWGSSTNGAADEAQSSAQTQTIFGQVTPWEIVAKQGWFGTLVWVTSFKTGNPVSGVKVAFYRGNDDAHGRLFRFGPQEVTTDANGLAILPGAESFPHLTSWKTNFYVGAIKAPNIGLLRLDVYDEFNTGGGFYTVTQPRLWAVTAQELYQPGATIHYAVFVRREGKHGLLPAARERYKLSIASYSRGQTYKLLQRDNVRLSAFGEVSGSVRIPESAPKGTYTISLSPESASQGDYEAGSFSVTNFRPSSFSVHVSLDRKHYGPGDPVIATTSATLHSGGPYTDADVKYIAAIVPTPFSPQTPITAHFIFDSNPQYTGNLPVFTGRSKLDSKGRDVQSFRLPSHSKVIYGQVMLQASVKSLRSTWLSRTTGDVYAARDRFVGLRSQQWLLEEGKPATIRYLVVNLAGQPRAGSTVKILLQRGIPTDTFIDGERKLKWVAKDSCTVVSTTAPGACKLTPEHTGRYRFVATVTDTLNRKQNTELDRWVTGPGRAQGENQSKLTLVPDAASYLPGQIAHILIQNPYPGANALVTVERNGILWKKVIRLKGRTPVIEVPIRKDYFPKVFLSVTIAKPRTAPPGTADGDPALISGELDLPIAGAGPSLTVDVKTERRIYKPRDTINVHVQVHTASGGDPTKTRLIAAVVDQGVLDLTYIGARYYDPRRAFYEPQIESNVEDYSFADDLEVSPLTATPEREGFGPAPPPGGPRLTHIVVTGSHISAYDLLSPQNKFPLRSIFRYSTYWNAKLTTDAEGRASFSFKLPDNLTRWRIFVMAFTPGEAMGVGSASIRTYLPIQLQPTLPNQAHVGDRFAAGFAVANRTSKKRTISTLVKASGPIIGHQTSKRDLFQVGADQRDFAWLDLAANKPGTIHLTASAVSGTLGDALVATVPVRRALAPATDAAYGSTTGAAASVPVQIPADALPNSVKLSVTLSPTILGSLGASLESLRDNPLQLWEMRLSRAVLASNYLKLKPVLPDSVVWPNAAKVINKTLADAADFQAPSGGMAYWVPRDGFASPWLSVYTALAFNWLSGAGHPAPEKVEQKLHAYLQKTILAPKPASIDAAAPILRAGALAALAPDGHLPEGAVAALLPKLSRLDLFGRALLLEAAEELHDAKSARIIVQSILTQANESAGAISFNETHSDAYTSILATPVRANCAVLDALSTYALTAAGHELLGSIPEKQVRWITGRRRENGAWLNSQEDVFCTTAFVHYAQAYESSAQNLTATVSLGKAQAGTVSFTSRRSRAKTTSVTAPRPGKLSRIVIARQGKGRLYYDVSLHYARAADSLEPADAGFSIRRSYKVKRSKHWIPVTENTRLKRGDIVRVGLVVDVPTERHHVVLTDPLPGALEAVNRKLATSERGLPNAQPGTTVLWFDYAAWPNFTITNGGFYHRETSFDAVRFYAGNLPAGHYHLIYAAQVISPGRFIAPPPVIKEIYQPDVFGRGAGQTITVTKPQ